MSPEKRRAPQNRRSALPALRGALPGAGETSPPAAEPHPCRPDHWLGQSLVSSVLAPAPHRGGGPGVGSPLGAADQPSGSGLHHRGAQTSKQTMAKTAKLARFFLFTGTEPHVTGTQHGIAATQRSSFHCRLLIADCRLKKWCGNSFQCPSARHGGQRQSKIGNSSHPGPNDSPVTASASASSSYQHATAGV